MFTVTLAPWGSISHLYSFPYRYQTFMWPCKLAVGTSRASPITNHQSSEQRKSKPASSHQAFFSGPFFVPWQRKVRKMYLHGVRMLFYPSFHSFFYSEFYIIKAYGALHYFCLAKVYGHSALPNVMKDPLLIASYFAEVVSKNFISEQCKMLKQWLHFADIRLLLITDNLHNI